MTALVKAQPQPKPADAIRRNEQLLLSCHFKMVNGEPPVLDRLRTVPSFKVIREQLARLKPSERPAIKESDLKIIDGRVARYAVTQLLHEVRNQQTADGRAGAYYHLNSVLQRFGLTPSQYLRDTPSASKREYATEIFKDGAIAFAKRYLAKEFEITAVTETDMAILRNRATSPADRLNALLRPLKYKDFMVAINALEDAGHDFGDPVFVDDIVPANVFSRVAVPEFDERRQRAQELMYKDVSTRLTRVQQASSLSEQSRLYGEVIEALAGYKLTPPQLVSTHPIAEWQEVMLMAFREGACAHAKYHLEGVLMASPLTAEDRRVLKSPDALATDKLNVLFQDSSNVCIRILNALEDAGLDFDDASWIKNIIPDNAFSKPQDPVLPVLVSK